MDLYGTYLKYLVRKTLTDNNKKFTIHELAIVILYPSLDVSSRETYNLEQRIRYAVNQMVAHKDVEIEKEIFKNNIKYYFYVRRCDNENTTEQSDGNQDGEQCFGSPIRDVQTSE